MNKKDSESWSDGSVAKVKVLRTHGHPAHSITHVSNLCAPEGMWEGEIGILESLRTGREWWVMREPVSKKLDWQLRMPMTATCVLRKRTVSVKLQIKSECATTFLDIYNVNKFIASNISLSVNIHWVIFYIADLKINGEVWDPLDTDKWNGREGPVSALWQVEGRSCVHGTPNNGSGRDVLKDRNRKVLLFDLIWLCLILFSVSTTIFSTQSPV